MSKITGIGGVFLNLNTNTRKLLKWYGDVLELDISEYGINFSEPNFMTLITFNRQEGDEAILNFAVDDIEDFVEKIRSRGVKIHKEIIEHPFGKFAQIVDIAGNIIELCQIDKDKYKEMVQKEIADFKE